jgi:hypothetical protein
MSMRRLILILSIVIDGGASRVVAQEPDLVIGVAEGPRTEVFGQVHDVVAGSKGDIFVLDNQALEVRWFDAAGEFRALAGGAGSGPGQLRSPQALEIDPAGDILVLDPLNRRISRFRPDDSRLAHVSDVPAPPAMDFCALDGRIYLLRLQPDSVITVLDRTGAVVAAWGELVEPLPAHEAPPEEMRSELENRARISCDPAAGTVTLLHERIPLVRHYTDEGVLLWQAELADYSQIRDVRTPDESGWMLAPDPVSGTAHSGRSIVSGAAGTLVITLWEGSAEGGRFEARVLSLSDGEEVGRSPVDMTITAVLPGTIIGYANSPVPRVLRYDASLLSTGRVP